ncbi:hypothetical protein E4T56_gene4619 [Termitomyces sp. T112]|nr:hypothetical protein E4T56_gene4619 [Termitomyces sp. T112]
MLDPTADLRMIPTQNPEEQAQILPPTHILRYTGALQEDLQHLCQTLGLPPIMLCQALTTPGLANTDGTSRLNLCLWITLGFNSHKYSYAFLLNHPSHKLKPCTLARTLQRIATRRQQDKQQEKAQAPDPLTPSPLPELPSPLPQPPSQPPSGPTPQPAPLPAQATPPLHLLPPPTITLGLPHYTASALPTTAPFLPPPGPTLENSPWASAPTCLGSMQKQQKPHL